MSRRTVAVVTGLGLVAGALRLVGLGSNPNGLFCDEASTGYDAFSLLHTARDQYGEFLPLFARSFGDFNEAFYRYLTVPAVGLFGLDEFAVRLPAALAGTLTVLALFALGRRWFDEATGFVAALLLAVSPWHLMFSRAAFRVILLPLFFCVALLCFDRGVKGNPRWLPVSALAFGAALYTYSAARLIVPLFLLVLVVTYWEELRRNPREGIVAAVLVGACLGGLATFWLSEQGMARGSLLVAGELSAVVGNYLSYLSPSFLFFDGDPELRHSALGFGQLHRIEMLTVLAGLVVLGQTIGKGLRSERRAAALLLFWLLLFPAAAALAGGSQALRSLAGAPAFALLSALGAVGLVRAVPGRSLRRVTAAALVAALAVSAVLFVHHYFSLYPRYSARHWQYGMRAALSAADAEGAECTVMSDQLFLPHIFHLFYNQVPPDRYQKAPVQDLVQGDWTVSDYSLDSFHVAPLELASYRLPNCVFIGLAAEMSRVAPPVRVIDVVSDPEERALLAVFRSGR